MSKVSSSEVLLSFQAVWKTESLINICRENSAYTSREAGEYVKSIILY